MGCANNVSAVIFDLDGTLLDTENIATEAINAVLEPHGGHILTWDVKEKILGMRDADCMLCERAQEWPLASN